MAALRCVIAGLETVVNKGAVTGWSERASRRTAFPPLLRRVYESKNWQARQRRRISAISVGQPDEFRVFAIRPCSSTRLALFSGTTASRTFYSVLLVKIRRYSEDGDENVFHAIS